MDFISYEFYILLAVAALIYYAVPQKFKWWVLLLASMTFYVMASGRAVITFLGMILLSYGLALWVEKTREKPYRAPAAFFSSAVTLAPLIMIKSTLLTDSIIVPLGISFFSMQMVAYIVDVSRGKIRPERNILKYALFISFFPQIIQGPIPRYADLHSQLIEGHKFDGKKFSKGIQIIIWGFFLKLVVADKAAVVVNQIYGNSENYSGFYILLAGVLYSIQLYTDFLGCVCFAKGAAQVFGIELADNFRRPYLSGSIKEFWGRWHITLSQWLKDYIYIPLGGNRKGRLRKYLNLIITFLVSGFWHGTGLSYMAWGALHGVYEVAGDLTAGMRNKAYCVLKINDNSILKRWFQRTVTFILVMIGWIIFRAADLNQALDMLGSIFTSFNPEIFVDGSILALGLSGKEWIVLILAVLIVAVVGTIQERIEKPNKGGAGAIRDIILDKPAVLRWTLYALAVLAVVVLGTYGFGFNAQDFIYSTF